MKIPGIFWVTLILVLGNTVPLFLSQWFPTNTFWWSAGIIVLIDAIVIAVKVSWPKQAGKVPDGVAAAPAPADATPKWKQIVFGA